MSITAEFVKGKLEWHAWLDDAEEGVEVSEYENAVDPWEWWSERSGDTVDVEELGSVHVEDVEDLGNQHLLVFSMNGQHFAQEGEWISHDGMYWEGDFIEVKPVPVTKIEWKSV